MGSSCSGLQQKVDQLEEEKNQLQKKLEVEQSRNNKILESQIEQLNKQTQQLQNDNRKLITQNDVLNDKFNKFMQFFTKLSNTSQKIKEVIPQKSHQNQQNSQLQELINEEQQQINQITQLFHNSIPCKTQFSNEQPTKSFNYCNKYMNTAPIEDKYQKDRVYYTPSYNSDKIDKIKLFFQSFKDKYAQFPAVQMKYLGLEAYLTTNLEIVNQQSKSNNQLFISEAAFNYKNRNIIQYQKFANCEIDDEQLNYIQITDTITLSLRNQNLSDNQVFFFSDQIRKSPQYQKMQQQYMLNQ